MFIYTTFRGDCSPLHYYLLLLSWSLRERNRTRYNIILWYCAKQPHCKFSACLVQSFCPFHYSDINVTYAFHSAFLEVLPTSFASNNSSFNAVSMKCGRRELTLFEHGMKCVFKFPFVDFKTETKGRRYLYLSRRSPVWCCHTAAF
jgi:hypothetical protein